MTTNRMLLVAACLGGLSFPLGSQAPQGDLEQRVATLETELALLKSANQELGRTLVETRTLADQTAKYLQAQAEGAVAMDGVIDQAVTEGFTWGENFASREILVAGWKARIAEMQAGLPGAKPVEEASSKQPARKR